MSTLSSTSTLAEIKAAYADNASYVEDNSTAKAAAFVTACRLLLLDLPTRAGQSGATLERDMTLIRGELNAAQSWLASQGTAAVGGPRVKFASFEDLR